MRSHLVCWIRAFFRWQVKLSRWLDHYLPVELRRDGNSEFLGSHLTRLVQPGMRIVDIGGGRHPAVSQELKAELGLSLFGLDCCAEELEAAPPGLYDATSCCDIVAPPADWAEKADLAICQSVLEHVPDVRAALGGVASLLREGGECAVFVPCRTAWFARVNLLLPERIKRVLLFSVFPHKAEEGHGGFKAYYDKCTPSELVSVARATGFQVVELQPYYMSSYFFPFVPAYLLWRAGVLVKKSFNAWSAAETFVLVLKKGTAMRVGTESQQGLAGVEAR